MEEETKDKCESQEENQSEKEDNRLPYEPPKLRKHGKVNDTTTLGQFYNGLPDNPFFLESDFSFALL
ncbi:DEAD/DEAH box helicase [Rivularia sp. UHCC 0363]|uniref:DEAD/DEAH box helicase n=1 Tax=Rivularia sp. UHCC 0363 TaxID=3110244 RepID=UPI002B215587|nr:DEAD/DEAH box helicase [Rivularia sp. UHCC 0363]MEA5593400.1 DEAD/DEAH box helicase [Rivularia sp. UHCC 0363]